MHASMTATAAFAPQQCAGTASGVCLAADSSAGRCSVNQGEFQLLAIAVHQGTGRQERMVEHCISTPFRVRSCWLLDFQLLALVVACHNQEHTSCMYQHTTCKQPTGALYDYLLTSA